MKNRHEVPEKQSRRNFTKSAAATLISSHLISSLVNAKTSQDRDDQKPNQTKQQTQSRLQESGRGEHDTPPPIVIGDSSLTVESREAFTEDLTGTRKKYKKISPTQAFKIGHIKILHGSGDQVYRNLSANGTQIHIWLGKNPPNPEPMADIIIKEEGAAFVIDSNKAFNRADPPSPPPNMPRKVRYNHPGPSSVSSFRVTRIRVTSGSATLFEVSVPGSTAPDPLPEEYRIFIWID
jgi:hypothetical protein